jgi:hypothetical protein
VEYVFDPEEYKETLLRNRCMGTQADQYPQEGQEAYV